MNYKILLIFLGVLFIPIINAAEIGEDWILASQDNNITSKYWAAAYTINNKIFIAGGHDDNGVSVDDIWSSNDNGTTWVLETGTADFGTLSWHRALSNNNGVYILGGASSNGTHSTMKYDVWHSNDGVNFSNIGTLPTNYTVRMGATIHNNKIFIAGGTQFGVGLSNAIYSSNDGVMWETMNASAEWAERDGYILHSLNNALYIVGGHGASPGYCKTVEPLYSACNDVWKSIDNGATWSQQNNITFELKNRPLLISTGTTNNTDQLLYVGGHNLTSGESTSFVYSTTDGNSWNLLSNEGFERRAYLQGVVSNNILYIINGVKSINEAKTPGPSNVLDNIWYSELTQEEQASPSTGPGQSSSSSEGTTEDPPEQPTGFFSLSDNPRENLMKMFIGIFLVVLLFATFMRAAILSGLMRIRRRFN